MTRTPKPTRETRREAAVKSRKRRCVRIEVVTSGGNVIDGYSLQSNGWWVRIGAWRQPDVKFRTSMASAHRTLRRNGYTHELTRTRIRKVYEEAT